MITAKNKKIKYGSKELEKEFGALTFGKLLESYRLSEEISQTAMAKKIKLSRQKLNDFEHGRRFPSLRMAASIAKTLKQHAPTWVSVVIEEMLRKDDLSYKVTLAS